MGFRVVDRLAFGRNGQPGEYAGRFRNDWEPLIWFQRPGADGWFDRSAVLTRAITGSRSDMTSGVKPDGSRRIRNKSGTAAVNGLRNRGSWWDYGDVAHGGAPDIEDQNHPARWPYRLAEDLVRCFCPPDGLVCDPFTGAGTTAAASIAWGRRFIGGDLFARQEDGKPWVDVAAHVLNERQRQKRLF